MYMPLMIDLKKVVVFGGERGEGLQKTEKLARYADDLLVVPEGCFEGEAILLDAGPLPHVGERLSLERERRIAVAAEPAAPANIERFIANATFVVSDLADRSLNELIFAVCRSRGILCNVIDTKELCSVWFMSLVDTPHIIAAISSKGECAYYAKQTRIELEGELDRRAPVAAILADIRPRIRPGARRAQILEAVYRDRDFQGAVETGDWAAAAARAEALRVQHVNEAADKEMPCRESSTT